MDVDSIICSLCVEMWDLAGTRLSWSKSWLIRGLCDNFGESHGKGRDDKCLGEAR
jgi:hypothetical protein